MQTLIDLISNSAKQYGDKTALICRPLYRAENFSFSDLWNGSRRVGHELIDRGTNRGDRVVLWASNSPYWVMAFFGIQLAGAIPVPLSPQNSATFVARVIAKTKARLVVKSQFLPRITGNESVDVELLSLSASGQKIIRPRATDLAELLFTSGTTGDPKGVELRHQNIVSNIESVSSLKLIKKVDRQLSFLPLSHIFEQVGGLFIPLKAGVTISQARSFASPHLRLIMEEDRPTVFTAVPDFLRQAIQRIELSAKEEGSRQQLMMLYKFAPSLPRYVRRLLAKRILKRFGGALRLIVSGGAALDPEIGAKWEAFGVEVLQGYGATETSPVVAINRPGEGKLSTVGPPIPGVEIKLAADGEILVKGPNVVSGYYHDQPRTEAAFNEGVYSTDDIGAFDSDGHLIIKGRKKFLIVTPAGENIYPEDVESVLIKEPSIRDAVVFALKDRGQFELHAVILPSSGQSQFDAAIARANQKLESYQQVTGWSVWPEPDFPRTVTKKAKRVPLLDWLKTQRQSENHPFLNSSSSQVAKLLATVTGRPLGVIKPSDKLVGDLKLDSLARVSLVGLIEEETSILIDEAKITPKTTVNDLEKLLSTNQQREEQMPFDPHPFGSGTVFWRKLVWAVCLQPFLRSRAEVEVTGLNYLSRLEPPVIFMANHTSVADSPYIKNVLPTKFRQSLAIAAATDQLWGHPVASRWHKLVTFLMATYPFSRNSQIKASFETTGRILDRDWSILVFPQGAMAPPGEKVKLQDGAGLLALTMNVPVIPVGCTGPEKIVPMGTQKLVWPKFGRVKINFGRPLKFSASTSVKSVTAKIEAAINELTS